MIALSNTWERPVTCCNVRQELHALRLPCRGLKLTSASPHGQIVLWIYGPHRRALCDLYQSIWHPCNCAHRPPVQRTRLGCWSICHGFLRVMSRSLVSYHYEMTGPSEHFGVRRSGRGRVPVYPKVLGFLMAPVRRVFHLGAG